MTPSNGKQREAALARLAGDLGAEQEALDASLTALSGPEVQRLADLVSESLARDADRVSAALEGTVRFVPRPLRGRARKMLFPEDER